MLYIPWEQDILLYYPVYFWNILFKIKTTYIKEVMYNYKSLKRNSFSGDIQRVWPQTPGDTRFVLNADMSKSCSCSQQKLVPSDLHALTSLPWGLLHIPVTHILCHSHCSQDSAWTWGPLLSFFVFCCSGFQVKWTKIGISLLYCD